MKRPLPSTLTIDKETKDAIKNLGMFLKHPQHVVLKGLLINKGFIKYDANYDIFVNWNEDTMVKYKSFLKLLDGNNS